MYHQHSYSQGYSGPPPAKKPKGNPIITRYPPPPGYKPPNPPPAWTPSVPQPYGFQPSYPAYGHSAYPQTQWPGYQQQQHAPFAYPQPSQAYCPTPGAAYASSLPVWPNQGSAPAGPPSWQQPPQQGFPNNKRRCSSTQRSATRTPSVTGPLDGNGDPLSPPRPGTGSDSYQNALEHEYDDECYYARHPDEIDPTLSLGLIEWHSALPTKLPLPATFHEAELEALAPRKPRPAYEESISEYFTRERAHEALLSVRQTEGWKEISDDVIYRGFAVRPPQTLTLWELVEKYRDRPDPRWTAQSIRDPAPALSRGATPVQSIEDADTRSSYAEQMEQSDILGNLEQALFLNQHANGTHFGSQSRSHSRAQSHAQSRGHSRAGSVCSTAGERITRPVPLAPVRDLNQENILAALGVTGSPKLVYQTPGPALGAPPPSSHHSRANSVSSVCSDARRSMQRFDTLEEEAQNEQPGTIGSERAGKSYGELDLDATPRPKHDRVDSGRKRSYGELDEEDEATPQQNRFKMVKA